MRCQNDARIKPWDEETLAVKIKEAQDLAEWKTLYAKPITHFTDKEFWGDDAKGQPM